MGALQHTAVMDVLAQLLEHQEWLVLWDQQDHLDHQDQWDLLDLLVHQVQWVPWALWVHQELLVFRHLLPLPAHHYVYTGGLLLLHHVLNIHRP